MTDATDNRAASRLGELYGLMEQSHRDVDRIIAANEKTRRYVRAQIAAVAVQVVSLLIFVVVSR